MNVYEVLQQILAKPKERSNAYDFIIIEEYAEEVLRKENDLSFETGLLGLGWIIAYLIREEYLDLDGDDILYDIDDNLYKLCIKEVAVKHFDVNRLIHFVSYYQERIQYKSSAVFYRRFTHDECMKLLIEKLNSFLTNLQDNDFLDNISPIVNVIWKFSYLKVISINNKLVDDKIIETIGRLVECLEQKEEVNCFQQEIAKLGLMLQQLDSPVLQENRKKILRLLVRVENIYDTTLPYINLLMKFPLTIDSFSKILSTIEDSVLLYHLVTNIKITKT